MCGVTEFLAEQKEQTDGAGEGAVEARGLLPAGETFRSLLALPEGSRTAEMYDVLHFPSAEATIRKGKFLDGAETKAAVSEAQAKMRTSAGKTSRGRGKKKKGRR